MLLWQRRLRYRFRTGKHRQRKQNRTALCYFLLLAIVVGGIYGFFRVEMRIGSLAQQAAVSKLNGTITKEVNRVVTEVFAEEAVNAQNLVSKQKDEDGKVLSMSTDYHTLNRMKSAMAIKVQEVLDHMDVVDTTVPVGMLFSDTFLTGFGFRVPVKVFVTNAIRVEYKDSMTAVGINQSCHRLLVEITVPARVAGLFSYEDTEVITQVPISETVIVGEVPQTYLHR